jgi:PIN domain nuclease of toxin-antitoxin system
VLLLDTHVLVWTLEGDVRRVGRRARAVLTRAESHDAVRVSPVSLFEVAALHALGRIRLRHSLEAWIADAFADGRVRIAELTRAIAIEAGGISRDALPDPLDRLLVATARRTEATFVTGDRRIIAYAASATGFRVQDVSR